MLSTARRLRQSVANSGASCKSVASIPTSSAETYTQPADLVGANQSQVLTLSRLIMFEKNQREFTTFLTIGGHASLVIGE
jgi:hypothetical protein